MKKKMEPLKLYTLNKSELVSKEQSLLKGGSGTKCGCAFVCPDAVCRCYETGDSGTYPTSAGITVSHQSSTRPGTQSVGESVASTNNKQSR